MYQYEFRESLEKIFKKLAKKNSKQMIIIEKKIDEIIQNLHYYKNLRSPLQHLKRVHIDNSFVLVFSVNETTKTITFEDYDDPYGNDKWITVISL